MKDLVAILSVLWVSTVAAPVCAEQAKEDGRHLPARVISFAQVQLVPDTVVLSEQRLHELDVWSHDFAEWQDSFDQWLARRRPRSNTEFLVRYKKPVPPLWLRDACQLMADDHALARSCELLATWNEDPMTGKNRRAAAAALLQQEAPTKTSWWQHVHVDGLWSTTQSDLMAFGLFGAHVTVEAKDRLQVFIAPGILLVSVPGISGRRELLPATDWGISYRLFRVGQSTVHFNLVHAWMLANRANLTRPNATLAGLSVTFRPHRQ